MTAALRRTRRETRWGCLVGGWARRIGKKDFPVQLNALVACHRRARTEVALTWRSTLVALRRRHASTFTPRPSATCLHLQATQPRPPPAPRSGAAETKQLGGVACSALLPLCRTTPASRPSPAGGHAAGTRAEHCGCGAPPSAPRSTRSPEASSKPGRPWRTRTTCRHATCGRRCVSCAARCLRLTSAWRLSLLSLKQWKHRRLGWRSRRE